MLQCIICRVATNILLLELREPLCPECLRATEEVNLRSSFLPRRVDLRDPLSGDSL